MNTHGVGQNEVTVTSGPRTSRKNRKEKGSCIRRNRVAACAHARPRDPACASITFFRQAAPVDRLGGCSRLNGLSRSMMWRAHEPGAELRNMYRCCLLEAKTRHVQSTEGLPRRRLLAQIAQMNCGRGRQRHCHRRRASFLSTSHPSCHPPSYPLPSCPRPSCPCCPSWGALFSCAVLGGVSWLVFLFKGFLPPEDEDATPYAPPGPERRRGNSREISCEMGEESLMTFFGRNDVISNRRSNQKPKTVHGARERNEMEYCTMDYR